ncbi:MAG: UTP--glucose-1-phosphate uridylyltransferase [Ruminococcaceae bacterium]|nr:UTP--glucose-1-phosphate uridylyltransferase [Oscillospiraceae bacterium]
MTKKITKAVIPAAGLGTRMLPIARTVPKEVLPIVDRPCIEYLVREAVDSGITDILIITNRGKGAIEDYFDYSPEYESALLSKGKTDEYNAIREIADKVNIQFIRQKQPKGLGHAVNCARAFIGDEPFVVLYGDDVIMGDIPVCRQLIDTYERYGLAVAGVKEVPDELVVKYCTLGVEALDKDAGEYKIYDMIEKPAPDKILSNYSILGRVLLTPDIFDILDNTPPGAGNEIQLTDAMRTLTLTKGMCALDFKGKRYDMGSKLGFLTANVDTALKHPELAEDFKAYLKSLDLN